MSAWGTEIFENDEVADWLYDLESSTDQSLVLQTLLVTIEEEGYLEIPEATCALAAAEVIACAFGKTGSHIPEEVIAWIRTHSITENIELPSIALQAVSRVRTESELIGLWDETEYRADWYKVVNDS